MGAEIGRHAGVHIGQATVAGVHQVLGHRPAHGGMVEADLDELTGLGLAVPQLDDRCAGARGKAQHRRGRRRVVVAGDGQRVGRPAQHGADLLFLTQQRIARGRQHQLESGRLKALGQRLHGLGEHRVGQAGHDGRDHAGPSAGQHAGLLVGHVAGGRQGVHDAQGGVGRHPLGLAQVARDGDLGGAGGLGHILQRDAAMAAPVAGAGFGRGRGQGWGQMQGHGCRRRLWGRERCAASRHWIARRAGR